MVLGNKICTTYLSKLDYARKTEVWPTIINWSTFYVVTKIYYGLYIKLPFKKIYLSIYVVQAVLRIL